jgi:YidC/Oxa1 family membrane protein insertase
MRKLKPQIDAINEKYGDDREKKGAAMMELYRKEKVNPAAGCLPSLLQMPVWFALYRSLSTNVELYHAPFTLYWTDLSSPDPYYVLPICVALLMHLQQRFTPTTADSTQMKMMMYFMPLMIGAFMLFLPAGLCLYMVTNSVLTMAQQRAIYAKLDREEEAKNATASILDDDDDEDGSDDEPADLQPNEALAGASSASARRRTIKRGKKRQRRG